MIETRSDLFPFRYRMVWFSDGLYDVDGCDSVIFRLCRKPVEKSGFTFTDEFHTLTIDLTQSLETIWHDMSKTNCRKPISHAVDAGVTVKRNENYEEFFDLYRQLRKTKGFTSNNIGIDYMKKYGTLFTTECNGELLGGMFYIEDENTILEIVTASKRFDGDKEKRNFVGAANKLLIWEAIRYAKAKGIKEYDQGGVISGGVHDEQLERITNYKMSFGGKPATKYNYRKDYSPVLSLLKRYVLKN